MKYVNEQLGGVGGHPVALVDVLHQVERGGRHDLRPEARQQQADHRRSRAGAVATGAQSLHATIGGAKPIVTGVAITPVDGASKTGVVLFGDGPHILLPFGNYAKNVLQAKTAAVVYPNAPGIAESGTGDRERPEGCRHRHEAGRLHAGPDRPDRAADRGRGDDGGLHRPYGSASDCANQAKALTAARASPTRERS